MRKYRRNLVGTTSDVTTLSLSLHVKIKKQKFQRENGETQIEGQSYRCQEEGPANVALLNMFIK